MKLLIVDDEQAICWALKQLGDELGHDTQTASSAEEAIRVAADFLPDVIVLDVRLPGMDGLTAMRHLREHVGAAPMIVITAHGDLETAVDAVRQGAFEYVVKPFDLARAKAVIERAARTVQHAATESTPDDAGHVQGKLIGKTPIMQEAFRRIALVAASDACVLISGESGAGKEVAARVIHDHSRRAAGRFVPVNVAALSPALAESELFGHVRGAFTGASDDRAGLLQEAHGGTLFLDEVADIPLSVQAKLLRVLEQREVYPVGSNGAVPTDFRMISATHRNLQRLVEEGKFRHDLYFRLCAFEINLPPLRERRGDIPLLVNHFVRMLAAEGTTPRVSSEAMQVLSQCPWYGNVRELRNAVEHALVLAREGIVMPDHLPAPAPPELAGGGDARSLKEQLTQLVRRWSQQQLAAGGHDGTLHAELLALMEKPLFAAALEHHHGQFAAAARTLGIHRTTLKKKVEES